MAISTVNRINRRVEDELIESQIKPAPKLKSSLVNRASVSETELFMQCNTGPIGDVDAAHHQMILLHLGSINQALQEGLADAPSAMIFVDVYRVFDRVLVCWPGAKGAVTGKTEESAMVIGATDDRKAMCLFSFKPIDHRFEGARLVVVKSR